MLESLTQPNYPRAALGFESQAITALSLQREGRGVFGIRQAATIDLPADLLVPSFTGRNISDSQEMISMLDEVLTTAGLLKQKKWSVSLPSNSARTAILTLDNEPSKKEELSDILDWKAENTFGSPARELRLSRRRIKSDESGKPRYFATAIKLSVIDEFESIFESLGWQAGLIVPRALSEARWLADKKTSNDSLLISSQEEGFVALLLRGDEPMVVRSVTCTESEIDDEIFRLLMFYRDRLGDRDSDTFLDKVLAIGKNFTSQKLKEIADEALGKTLTILRPADVGLNFPIQNINFNEIAAPAGLATLGWK
jgi:Tfp pilus assembly PilM family ATPase